MQRATGIIFDMDGVFVDSAAAHRRAWQCLGDEVGTPFSDALFDRTFGQRNASIIPAWLGDASPAQIEELGARKEILYRQLVRGGGVRIYPRVRALLAELRQLGAATAVASSGPRANVRLLIETIGADQLIDAVVSAEDVSEGKPHPQGFLTAAARVHVAPAHCAVIEDSVHGVEAAKRAGMIAVAVLTSTGHESLVAAGADLVVAEVGALRARDLVLLATHGVTQPPPAP